MNLRPYLIGATAGAALTLALLWALQPDPVPEPAAPAIVLPSGAVVAERVPDAPLPPVAAEAARELGGETVRAGSVTVQPGPSTSRAAENQGSRDGEPQYSGSRQGPVDSSAPPCRCDPIRLDWSLTRTDDGHRMSWYTDGGTITEAVDIPASATLRYAQPKWAAGVSAALRMDGGRDYGVWLDRDLWRLRLSVELSQRDGGTASLRAGIRF